MIGGDSRKRHPWSRLSGDSWRRQRSTSRPGALRPIGPRARAAAPAEARPPRTPRIAAPTWAPRQPYWLCIASNVAGATAEPRCRRRCGTRTPAQAAPAQCMGEKRIVGRMIRGVANPGDGIHGDEHGEGIDDAGDRKGGRADNEAGNQHTARADPVDEKSGGRLQQRRGHVAAGQCQPKIGIAHAIVRAHEHEQRARADDVVVADKMGKAHAADGPVFHPRADERRSGRVIEAWLLHGFECLGAGAPARGSPARPERRQPACRHGGCRIGECVDDRIRHAGEGPRATGLAASLDAERIGLGRHRMVGDHEHGGTSRARHGVIHERAGQQLAVPVVDRISISACPMPCTTPP